MRDVASWIRGMRASSGAPIQALDDDRAVAMLFVGSTTEPGPDGTLFATEPGFRGSLFVEDGICDVGLETSGCITDSGVAQQK
jgi:hypothetical protein